MTPATAHPLAIAGARRDTHLARPEKLNALDMDDGCGARARLRMLIETSSEIRVAILTGEGEKSFCAGGDIEAWAQNSPLDFGRAWIRYGHRAFDALARLRQPVDRHAERPCAGRRP